MKQKSLMCAQTENNPNSFKLLKDKTKKTVKKVITDVEKNS